MTTNTEESNNFFFTDTDVNTSTVLELTMDNVIEPVVDPVEEISEPINNGEDDTETPIDPVTEETIDPESESEEEESVKIDYEAEYKKLLKFKANGEEIELQSGDELVQLAQKGANYTKRSMELAKHQKFIKTLEENKLLDSEKINFLIDIYKGNEDAIAKHIKELKINPLTIDTDTETTYTTKDYMVSDERINQEEFINTLYEDPHGKEVLDDLTKWDSSSVSRLLQNPNNIRDLTEHKRLGYYETIQQEVKKQRLLGNLGNISDIDAYAHIGRVLTKEGKLKPNSISPVPVEKVIDVKKAVTKIKQETSSNVNKLSPLSGKTNSSVRQEVNIKNMTDEQFVEYFENKRKQG